MSQRKAFLPLFSKLFLPGIESQYHEKFSVSAPPSPDLTEHAWLMVENGEGQVAQAKRVSS